MTSEGYDPEDPEPPEQPRCSCGGWLPWKHTSERVPVEGVIQYIWWCNRCQTENILVEDVADTVNRSGGDLPF